jgi:hypothetical protein
VNRETTEERLIAIKEQLHEIANIMHSMALRVDILWEERQRRREKAGPDPGDRR